MTPALDVTVKKTIQKAGLRYVQDSEVGYVRQKTGKSFYYTFKNKRVTTAGTLKRLKSLVIPPAWQSVWICSQKNGHLQVTGRDLRGRKQYIYHPDWSRVRNENKFKNLLAFGKSLPLLRKQVAQDLKRKHLDKEKVIAAVILLMQETCIRIGNDTYAKENNSYGLTTLLNKHATIRGTSVRFRFRGKSGVDHDCQLQDPRLSRIIKRCQELPGAELFCYLDENEIPHDITSTDINDYLKTVTNLPFTAKDFRTWVGTVKALEEIVQCGPQDKVLTTSGQKKRQLAIIQKVASELRNTVAVCRKYYVHPIVFESDEKGLICDLLKKASQGKSRYLSKHETLLLHILKKNT